MLDADGRVRITDFGLAGLAGSFTDIRSGTPAYMAPEQLAGKEVIGAQRPLLARPRALRDLHRQARLRRDDDRRAAAPCTTTASSVSRERRRASWIRRSSASIQRCLSRDPAERPASAIAVSAALPGGDPLAAALAAGETPSPAMVAAAGRMERGAAARSAWRCWSRSSSSASSCWSACVAAASSTATCRWSCPGRCSRIARARRSQRLGYPRDAGRRLRPAARRRRLSRVGPQARPAPTAGTSWRRGRTPAFGYWYRTSPRAAACRSRSGAGRTLDDPPLRVVGMTLARRRRRRGFLLEFHARAAAACRTGGAAAPPVDWQVVFDVVGWPRDRFTPAAPEWTPLAHRPTRGRRGPARVPELGATPLRLEAGAFAGTHRLRPGDRAVDAAVPRGAARRSAGTQRLLNMLQRAADRRRCSSARPCWRGATCVAGRGDRAAPRVSPSGRRRADGAALARRRRTTPGLRHRAGRLPRRLGRRAVPRRHSSGSPTSASSRGCGGTGRRSLHLVEPAARRRRCAIRWSAATSCSASPSASPPRLYLGARCAYVVPSGHRCGRSDPVVQRRLELTSPRYVVAALLVRRRPTR